MFPGLRLKIVPLPAMPFQDVAGQGELNERVRKGQQELGRSIYMHIPSPILTVLGDFLLPADTTNIQYLNNN